MVQRYDPDVNCHLADDGDYVEYADYEKLALYKDYVESRIVICAIPLRFSEWDKCVNDLADELEKPLKENELWKKPQNF